MRLPRQQEGVAQRVDFVNGRAVACERREPHLSQDAIAQQVPVQGLRKVPLEDLKKGSRVLASALALRHPRVVHVHVCVHSTPVGRIVVR